MPATSVRDLVVKGDDLVIGTHGRSFWILDDVTPLRQMTPAVAAARAHLFEPQKAIRIRRNRWTDTPVPVEEPAGENPPDGAILDYFLGASSASPVVLEIRDAAGAVVRRYASDDAPEAKVEPLVVTADWARPALVLPRIAGHHRWVWDLRYAAPPVSSREYPISAVPGRTPPEPEGPLVLPGTYTAALTVDGRTLTRPLTVAMDPRVKASAGGPRGAARGGEASRRGPRAPRRRAEEGRGRREGRVPRGKAHAPLRNGPGVGRRADAAGGRRRRRGRKAARGAGVRPAK